MCRPACTAAAEAFRHRRIYRCLTRRFCAAPHGRPSRYVQPTIMMDRWARRPGRCRGSQESVDVRPRGHNKAGQTCIFLSCFRRLPDLRPYAGEPKNPRCESPPSHRGFSFDGTVRVMARGLRTSLLEISHLSTPVSRFARLAPLRPLERSEYRFASRKRIGMKPGWDTSSH